jgi:adenosine deaminase
MKIFLSPLHIELRLIKCLVKTVAKTHSKGFQYLSKKFPNISIANLKEVIFVGPQIQEVLEDETFVKSVTQNEQVGKAFSGSVQTS